MVDEGPLKKDSLLIIRGIACLVVFENHSLGLLIENLGDVRFLGKELNYFVPFGFQAVWLFLAISGFLLTKAFLDRRFELTWTGIARFVWSRFLRLWPLLLVVQTAVFLLLSSAWRPELFRIPSFAQELQIVLLSPLAPYSPATHAVGSGNSPVWSVLIEFHLLLLLPLLLCLLKRWPKAILTGIIVCWATRVLSLAQLPSLSPGIVFPFLYESHFYNCGFFLIGVLAAFVKRDMPTPSWARLGPTLVVTTLAYAWIHHVARLNLETALVGVPPVLFSACLFSLLLALDTSFQERLPTTYSGFLPKDLSAAAFFERVGAMSYSVYLCHKVLSYFLVERLRLATLAKSPVGCFTAHLVLIGFVLLVSLVLYIEVENRFRVKGKNSSKKQIFELAPTAPL